MRKYFAYLNEKNKKKTHNT